MNQICLITQKKQIKKNATGIEASPFAKKVNLANLKSDVDKSNIDKLKNIATNLSNLKSKVDKIVVDKLVPIPDDLSKLSDVAKNDVAKKLYIYIYIYNAKTKNLEDEMTDITNLAAKNCS